MRLDINVNVQIASRAAARASLPAVRNANALVVVDAFRNVNVNVAFDADFAGAATAFAGIFNNSAGTLTAFARTRVRNHAKRRARGRLTHAGAVTVGAGFGRSSFSRAGAVAVGTIFHARNFDIHFLAESGFLETNAQVVAQIGAAFGTRLTFSASPAAAEKLLKNIAHVDTAAAKSASSSAENVIEIETAHSAGTAAAAWLERRVSKLVVLRAFLRVFQNVVGDVNFLHFRLGSLGVVAVQIRMIFLRKFLVRLLQLVVRGVFVHAENLIQVFRFVSHNLTFYANQRRVLERAFVEALPCRRNWSPKYSSKILSISPFRMSLPPIIS